jgi:hypothetical protein
MSDSWYQKNVDNDDLKKKEAEQQSGSGVRRLWIKPETSMRVIFLDDEQFSIWEHNPMVNNSYKDSHYTCTKGMEGGCALCDSKFYRYYIGFLSVLDAEGWVSTKGKNKGETVGKYARQLLPMKTKSLRQLNVIKQNMKADGKSLVGAMFTLTRTGSDSPTCGDVWTYVKHVDLDSEEFMFKSKLDNKMKSPEPFDYLKVFKPLSRREMTDVGRGASQGKSKDSGGSNDDDYSGEGKDYSGGGDDDALY